MDYSVEARIARLESDVSHLGTDVADIKTDLRSLRDRMDAKFDALTHAHITRTDVGFDAVHRPRRRSVRHHGARLRLDLNKPPLDSLENADRPDDRGPAVRCFIPLRALRARGVSGPPVSQPHHPLDLASMRPYRCGKLRFLTNVGLKARSNWRRRRTVLPKAPHVRSGRQCQVRQVEDVLYRAQ